MILIDTERAKQIMDSYGVIEVLYNGRPVWIEDVMDTSIVVTYLGSNDRIEVPVNSLEEGRHTDNGNNSFIM